MKRFILSAVFVAIGQSIWAGETIDQSMDAEANVSVVVTVVRGKVSVTGWDKNSVNVRGKLDEKSEGLRFEKRGSSIVIEDKTDNNLRRGEGSDLTIYIPRGGNLEVELVSADLSVKDIAGRSELQTVSGDIVAEKLGHVVEMESVSGDIDLKGAGREVSLESVSGNIKAHVTAQRLESETVSGDISIRNEGELTQGDFSVVSGDVQIDSALSNTIDLEMESVSGRLTLFARGHVNARVEAETGPGGDIVNELTNDVPHEEEFTGAESLSMKVGDGRGRIRASVVTGDIELRKK